MIEKSDIESVLLSALVYWRYEMDDMDSSSAMISQRRTNGGNRLRILRLGRFG